MAVIKPGGETSQRKEQQMALDAMRAKDAAMGASMEAATAPRGQQRMGMDAMGEVDPGRMMMSRPLPGRMRGFEGDSGGMGGMGAEVAAKPATMAVRPQEPVAKPMMSRPRPVAARQQPQAAQETPPEPKTELEGGAIPTTEDEWQSKAEWEAYTRRQETETGLRRVAELRKEAELADARAKVFERRGEIATGYGKAALTEAANQTRAAAHLADMSGEAVRTADVQAGLVLGDAALASDDQRRASQIAALNVEALEAETVFRAQEAGGIRAATAAQVEQREAQIAEVTHEAELAIQDATLAAQRAEAETQVMSAARGAGGAGVEAQRAEVRTGLQRQVGRIGTKREIAHARLQAGIKEVESRADIAIGRSVVAMEKAKVGQAQERLRIEGHKDRAKQILDKAKVQADEIRTKGGKDAEQLAIQAQDMTVNAQRSALSAASFEADAAGLRLDAKAEEANAEFGRQAATQGLNALINRPPIPDWNAIGRKAETSQRWQRASGLLDFGSKIVGLFF